MTSKKIFFFLTFFLLIGCTSSPQRSDFSVESKNGAWELRPPQETDAVILVPQWHLSPQTNTRSTIFNGPQKENQIAIYNEISNWIQKGQVQSVLVEGCEGNIRASRHVSYNGWSLDDLDNALQNGSIEEIQTHVGNKLTAKFKNKEIVVCGDDLRLLNENQLALSDIRGLAGFKTRIEQAGLSDTDRERFISGLKSVFKLPATTKTTEVLRTLDLELRKSIDRFQELIHERNDSFLTQARSLKGRKVIVIGDLHIPDLKEKLTAQKTSFSVWRPTGLDSSDSNLIEKLRKILRR